MWPGTQQQYFELYEAAAKAIKAYDPALQVGGPAVCNIAFPLIKPFLAYCRDRQLPLDFVTWHCYAAAPEVLARDAATAPGHRVQHGAEQPAQRPHPGQRQPRQQAHERQAGGIAPALGHGLAQRFQASGQAHDTDRNSGRGWRGGGRGRAGR